MSRYACAALAALCIAAAAAAAGPVHAQATEAGGAAEAAGAADLAPAGLEAPIRVDGSWTGVVFEGGARFSERWRITQAGGRISGEVTSNRIGASGYGKYSISGHATTGGVTYQADNWASRRPPGWCLPAGSLRYSRDADKEYLSGQLRPNSVSGGCSGHMPTARRNLTSRGDTGRVVADCSKNSSAGACPRSGRGTIKLERALR